MGDAFGNTIGSQTYFIFGKSLFDTINLFLSVSYHSFLCFSQDLFKSFLLRILTISCHSSFKLRSLPLGNLWLYNMWVQPARYKVVYNELLTRLDSVRGKGCWWSDIFTTGNYLRRHNILKVYEVLAVNKKRRRVLLFRPHWNANLFWNNSCWLCPSFHLAFGSSFSLCPFSLKLNK